MFLVIIVHSLDIQATRQWRFYWNRPDWLSFTAGSYTDESIPCVFLCQWTFPPILYVQYLKLLVAVIVQSHTTHYAVNQGGIKMPTPNVPLIEGQYSCESKQYWNHNTMILITLTPVAWYNTSIYSLFNQFRYGCWKLQLGTDSIW